MSATLTWRRTTATKTGTAVADLINDIVTAVNAVVSDADYKWEVASSNNGGSPYYVVLKPKDGSAGRLLLVVYTSSPAGANSAIFDTSPATGYLFVAWFPNGNVDTPSNLSASSGTIMGSDTDVIKAVMVNAVSTLYGANLAVQVFDSEEAVILTFQNPSASTAYVAGGGKLMVDENDDAHDAVIGSHATGDLNNFAAVSTSSLFYYSSGLGTVQAGSTSPSLPGLIRSRMEGSSKTYCRAYIPAGWGSASFGSSLMFNESTSKAYFEPVPLLNAVDKGVGIVAKLRQIALGPPSNSAYSVINSPALSPAAINLSGNASGATSFPWLVNFKI